MIFAKIDYINLLPINVYLKKYPLPNALKSIINYKKDVPSALNKALFFRRIDGAFISSIESVKAKYKTLNLGICANKKVLSVIVEKNTNFKNDKSSATSNVLARILKQNHKVIIGDEALRLYLKKQDSYVDLCSLWYEKTRLPFVFARFSCIRHRQKFNEIFKNFSKHKVKIPFYILEQYAKSRALKVSDIKLYLNFIYYEFSYKEQKALRLFIKKAKV